MLRLVSADAVKDIICRYENRNIQKTMVWEIEKLTGVVATDEQLLEILGNDDIKLDSGARSAGVGRRKYEKQ
ncbi:hypothetical protein HL650_06545 [Blautia pseudococcoides]|uniref:hypothetical protein n=1 Tax=Blautia pseudococcoides TaxID=1796616 RepID=UPI00148B28D5|nr:hypothetical protein [Blautia pseudococcoides]QJU14148.1 hypothetical protein HL650_06545 [Blautia pseudococcoides]